MSKPIVPTLIDLPSELRGPRVLLRPYRVDDAEQLFAAIDESRDHLRPWVTWVLNNRTVDDVRDYCIRSQASWLLRTELVLGIFDAASGRYLGGIELHDPDWQLRAFEIGYWLRLSAATQRNRPGCWQISRCLVSKRAASRCAAVLATTPVGVWPSVRVSRWRVACATPASSRTGLFPTSSFTPSFQRTANSGSSPETPSPWQRRWTDRRLLADDRLPTEVRSQHHRHLDRTVRPLVLLHNGDHRPR